MSSRRDVTEADAGAGRATAVRLACEDAARSGARTAALGEDAAAVASAARAAGGDGARVSTTTDGTWVTVVVSRDVGVAAWAGPVTVSATAVARVEP